jgi:hypothetical protein
VTRAATLLHSLSRRGGVQCRATVPVQVAGPDGQRVRIGSLRIADDGVELTLPSGTHRLRPERVYQSRVDEVLRRSLDVCEQLNAEDPDLVERLTGRPGWLVEMDARGMSVAHPDERHTRLDWPTVCYDVDELVTALRDLTHRPIPRARAV